MPRTSSLLHSSHKQQTPRQYQAVAQFNSADDDELVNLNDNEIYEERPKRISKIKADQIQERQEHDGARRRVASRNRSSSNASKATATASTNSRLLGSQASSQSRANASSESRSVGSDGLSESYRLSIENGADDVSDGSQNIDEEGTGENYDELNPPDDSPYSQVRASVLPTDDLSLSINTPRMWTLSMLFAALGSSTNLFFSLRYPSVSLSPIIALLLVHPLGLLWDRVLKRVGDPDETYVHGTITKRGGLLVSGGYDNLRNPADWLARSSTNTSSFTQRGSWQNISREVRLWLAQGCWNEKEHTCVYISSNVSFGFAFATDVSDHIVNSPILYVRFVNDLFLLQVIVEQVKFYKQDVSIVYQILLILSTQILGYAFAGITRRYLVQPSGMVWPGTLVSSSLFSTLHKNRNQIANGWRISPARLFSLVLSGSLGFYFLPGLLMPALSYFNVITWFAPNNVVIANLVCQFRFIFF